MNGRATRPAAPVPSRPPRPDLLAPFVGRAVELVLTTGETWRGELREVGLYELVLRRDDGRAAVIHKGAVVAVLPVPRG